MLEYVFFDDGLRDKFIAFAREQGVTSKLSDDDEMIVLVPEDLDDAVGDRLDYRYEQLLQENADLLEGTEDGWEKNAAGVQVQLADGSPCMVRLDPDLMARLVACIGLEELRDLVQTVATSVENPDNRPLCHT